MNSKKNSLNVIKKIMGANENPANTKRKYTPKKEKVTKNVVVCVKECKNIICLFTNI